MNLEQRLSERLNQLKSKSALRTLKLTDDLIDFCSNDYLGLAFNQELQLRVSATYAAISRSGSGGSRLLSGNHPLMEQLEKQLCTFHNSTAALLFNSGYDANLSIFSCLPARGDLIIFDSLVHASIHDGMRMGKAEMLSFKHNDCIDLKQILALNSKSDRQIFVAVESVYSMDGDLAPLTEISELCKEYGAALIVDEAHATGVFGKNGLGRVQELGLENKIFARLHTFGKAIGGHGAVVLGSELLKQYLINFSRPLIFSTAMSLHDIVHASEAYQFLLKNGENLKKDLHEKIKFFRSEINTISHKYTVIDSISPIQGIVIPGNDEVIKIAQKIQQHGFDVRPIRFPSVAAGTERLRICIHMFNTEKEIGDLIKLLS